jgi:hypothetical protein
MDARQRSRVGALVLAALMLLTACATEASMGRRMGTTYRPPMLQASPAESWAAEAEADGHDTGGVDAVLVKLPTDFAPVQVRDSELTATLAALVLHLPLRVATSCSLPLDVGRSLVLVSAPSRGEVWQSDLARSYGRYCERRGSPSDCLRLFEDGPRFQDDDKRSLALALAVGPALEGVDAEVRVLLNPTMVLATVSIAITGYMALLLWPVPEPVSKSLAGAFTLLMWGYLGWEFFDLMRAYVRLHEDAPRASTFAELREIGERFGRVIGPNSVRILVMVGTAAIGETAALVSKAPKLPGFEQASRAVEVNTGLRLVDAATGAERVIVSVPEGTIRIVLPTNVTAMAAPNRGGARSVGAAAGNHHRAKAFPNGYRAFKSFEAFKRFMGSAGEGNQWHHIIEKHKTNLERFGAEALHNTENVIPVNGEIHARISAFYSSIQKFSEGMTVREWLSTQSYEAQRAFGLQILRDHGVIP